MVERTNAGNDKYLEWLAYRRDIIKRCPDKDLSESMLKIHEDYALTYMVEKVNGYFVTNEMKIELDKAMDKYIDDKEIEPLIVCVKRIINWKEGDKK